jgi:hypothetical protein
MTWIDENLNWEEIDEANTRVQHRHPSKGQLSIEFIEGWSRSRIAILAIIPVVFSLAIGFYYQYAFDDVQTAWSLASYIVTTFAGNYELK